MKHPGRDSGTSPRAQYNGGLMGWTAWGNAGSTTSRTAFFAYNLAYNQVSSILLDPRAQSASQKTHVLHSEERERAKEHAGCRFGLSGSAAPQTCTRTDRVKKSPMLCLPDLTVPPTTHREHVCYVYRRQSNKTTSERDTRENILLTWLCCSTTERFPGTVEKANVARGRTSC